MELQESQLQIRHSLEIGPIVVERMNTGCPLMHDLRKRREQINRQSIIKIESKFRKRTLSDMQFRRARILRQ